MISHELALRCPRCLSSFNASPEELVCAQCGTHFPILDGIADLRLGRKDYYFNPVSRPKMAGIIRDVSAESWPGAVRRFLAEVNFNPDWLDNLVADGRYAWKLFLGLVPDARVLDLGCGLGNLTKNVAPHVGEMYALDLTWERLQFAGRRFSVFNQNDHISLVAGGDGDHLPFADGTFDCVMMSGVLEWVADDSTQWADTPGRLAKLWKMLRAHVGRSNPRRVQLRFLKEIRRVLKPSGQLFIAIENRLSYEYFAGHPDHHCGLPYASLLPRALATLYAIFASHRPYRTYTYAYPGYRRLLREAGFARCGFLGLMPGYSHLSEIIPFDENGTRWLPRSAPNLKQRVRASKLFVPAYGIVASVAREEHCPSLIERIAREVELAAGQAAPGLRLSRFRITGKAKGIAKGTMGGRGVVLRIALNEQAAIAEQANHDALVRITENHGALKRRVPASVASGNVQNVPYFVEEEARGTPMDGEVRHSGPGAFLAQVGLLLQEMNPGLERQDTACLEGEVFRREVDDPFAKISLAVEDAGLIAGARAVMAKLLMGARVRYGLTHGDLNPENMFVANGEITGVIDWEYWSPRGLPILDAINFVEGGLRIRNRSMAIAETVLVLGEGKALAKEQRDFLLVQYRAMGFDPARHRGFVYLYWLQHVCKQISDGLGFNPLALETAVRKVLRQIAASDGRPHDASWVGLTS